MFELWRRVLYLVRSRRQEADLASEIDAHRTMLEDDLVANGLSRDAARAEACRTIGNPALNRNRARDVWIWPWLQDLAQDVRFASRLLNKDRRFTVAAVTALSLAIGANTTVFTFVNSGILRPLPYATPDRLVTLEMRDTRNRPLGVSYADARDWRESAHSLSHLAVSFDFTMNVSDEGLAAARYFGSYISPEAFDMAGVRPLLGRTFTAEDDRTGAPRVAILAHTVWQSRYSGDPAVVGRTIRINDAPTTVVGIMPPRFHFPLGAELWQPSAVTRGPTATLDERRSVRNVLARAMARLADGATVAQAQAEMDAITTRLARDFPETNAGISVRVTRLDDFYRQGYSRMLFLLMAAVVVVLLIACVNVGSLLLARAVHRSREMAIRASLGGTRLRMIRQLAIESVLVAMLSGAIGLIVALYGVKQFAGALMAGFDGPTPPWLDVGIDRTVFGFLAVASALTALLFGVAPALHVSRTDVIEVLKDGGRTATGGMKSRRWTGVLMIGELALTVVLLASAALLTRSFLAVYRAGQVVDTSDLVTMRLTLSGEKYATPDRIKQFFRTLDERLTARAELGTVTVASDVPLMTMTNSQRQLEINSRPLQPGETPPLVAYLYIGPRYFEALRLSLKRGRHFTDRDGLPGQEGIIVNEQFAAMFFPASDPIGERIRLTNAAAPQAPRPWFTIIGVAPTVPQIASRERPDPVVYASILGEPAPHRLASILARTSAPPAAAIATMREEVRRLDPSLAGYFTWTLEQVTEIVQRPYRLFGSIFGLLAAIALLLSSVGLYALTAHGVAARHAEIGVRMALGARATQVLWLFTRATAWQLALGLALGIVGAVAAGRQLTPYLVKTPPTDVVALGGVALLLLAVTLTASLLSARRAMHVDPIVALRHE
jgi:putative ABC transport system permease protein